MAHQLVAKGRKKFPIPLLLEEVNPNKLGEVDADLKLYIETHTYTDCKDTVSAAKNHRLVNYRNNSSVVSKATAYINIASETRYMKEVSRKQR